MSYDNIFKIVSVDLENKFFINLLHKLYQIQKNKNNFNNCYFSKSIFKTIIKYYQNQEINNILNIIKNCNNSWIVHNAIESLSMLDDNNFTYVFDRYKEFIKSQEYVLFFSSIIKIVSKQDFIINYWITSHTQISNIKKIQYKILKSMSTHIYNIKLIDKLLEYIDNTIYHVDFEILFVKL